MLSNSSPLSPKAKINLVKQLKKQDLDDRVLLELLLDAAIQGFSIPLPEQSKQELEGLQMLVKQFATSKALKKPYEALISARLEKQWLAEFRAELEEGEIDEASWSSNFLFMLTSKLSLKAVTETLVEVGIKDGKLYWHIMQGKTELYNRQGANKYDYESGPVLRMDWALFQTFYNAGKRTSPVKITLDLFCDEFSKKYREDTEAIWEELKEKGILTKGERLSRTWNALTSEEPIRLTSIDDSKIKYQTVANALHNIANNPKNAETFSAIQGAALFRPDRGPKSWSEKAKVGNLHPKTNENRTQAADVNPHAVATHHRNTSEEKIADNSGDMFHYEHIPSASALKNYPSPVKIQYDRKREELEKGLQKLKAALEKKDSKAPAGITRNKQSASDKKARAKLMKDIASIETALFVLTKNFHKECDDKGWTIAVPRKWHLNSETFGEAASEQKKHQDNVFLSNFLAYKSFIESADPLTAILFLGGFRTQFYVQTKAPDEIAGICMSSKASPCFFSKEEDRRAIDKAIFSQVADVIQKRF